MNIYYNRINIIIMYKSLTICFGKFYLTIEFEQILGKS